MGKSAHLRSRRAFASGAWAVVLALLVLASLPSAAYVVNGTFDAGLSGWVGVGDVEVLTEASLGDEGTVYSLLYQGVALPPGQFRLEFDFLNLMSGEVPTDPFAFPDTFYASLYFINDLGTFDLDPLNPVFDDLSPVMDLDAFGLYNAVGTLSASPLGGNWQHFTHNFTNNFGFAIPTFELLDLNAISGDSEVRIDNVSIQPFDEVVPEPATLGMVLMGLVGTAATRKRASKI